MLLVACMFVVQAQKTAVKKAAAPAKAKPVAVKQAVPAEEKEWDFFQIGFWMGIPPDTNKMDVYGIKVGAPFSSGKGIKVIGIETAVFCGMTDTVEGIQACILSSVSKKVVGFQGSIINFCDVVKGLQFGIVNVAKSKSFQLGIINIIKDSSLPFFPIINFRF